MIDELKEFFKDVENITDNDMYSFVGEYHWNQAAAIIKYYEHPDFTDKQREQLKAFTDIAVEYDGEFIKCITNPPFYLVESAYKQGDYFAEFIDFSSLSEDERAYLILKYGTYENNA